MDLETHAFVTQLRGVYGIVNEGERDPIALTYAILRGGARLVQYRAKAGIVPDRVRAIRAATREARALFILNDDWPAVEEFDADGVHVGPDDVAFGDLARVRERVRGRILGVSCGTQDEAKLARAAGADYLGVGSVFPTPSKADAGAPIGIEGLQRVAAAASLPVAAIGGITAQNIALVRDTGVAMAAVISAIAASADPQSATADLVARWNA